MSHFLQVVLSIRDPDKWYDSYVASLLWLYRTWWFKPFSWCFPMGWKLQVSDPPARFEWQHDWVCWKDITYRSNHGIDLSAQPKRGVQILVNPDGGRQDVV